ncbi:WGR domain-containing protein [Nitratireductor sp. StC3]|uniref:WGR domain-containing protein n=1 Tax=Nitratireductor sp. StC3 TaxID=2126741 RepID=UPI001FDF4078|nr:WGR domain-containing protein [Nitratireductor sp. StC3]
MSGETPRIEPGRPQAGSPSNWTLSISIVNRWRLTDSQNALDGVDLGRDDHIMQTEDAIHLHRIDPARNMARFYRISSTPSLFGDICLVREWGRIGRPGRIRIDLYQTGEAAIAAREALSRVKQRRGYRNASGMG